MPPDSSTITDLIALWPIALLAAAGLWVWLRSEATIYDDGSSHLDHMSGANVSLALLALAAALVLAGAAIRTPRRSLVAAALAMSAIACLAQTYGFFGYTTPG